jgi:RNA polymerase sigma-70 factor, ECF subfamily
MLLCTNSLALPKKSQPAHHTISEARMVEDAHGGKPQAFEALCQTLRPRLFKIALRITRNREDAEDAVQDSMMRAFVHLKEFRGNSTLSTWLTRIVMNSALMINRKTRNSRQVSADDLATGESGLYFQIPDRSPNPEQSCVDRERKAILHRAIRKLRPRMRAVVEVAQFQELPMKEAAKVLDISVAAAKGRFFHARAALRKSVALRVVAQARKRAVTQARTEPAA